MSGTGYPQDDGIVLETHSILKAVTLQNTLADKARSLVIVMIGASFTLCVLLFRRGIVGELHRVWSASGRVSVWCKESKESVNAD